MACSGLIVFDLDGTLFHTETAFLPAVKVVFRSFGLPNPDPDLLVDFIGRPGAEFCRWLREIAPRGREQALIDAVACREMEMITACGALYDGVPEMLRELRNMGFRLAVCSNGGSAYVEHVLRETGIYDCFCRLRSRGPSDQSKSQMLEDLLFMEDTRPAVMVGDRASDLEAAADNGIPMIGTLYGYGSMGELMGAGAKALEAAEIPGFVIDLTGC